jgi:hypothetical protein
VAVTLTAEQRLALRDHAIGLRVLVDLYLGSGTYRFWDGAEHYTIDGNQYLAAGAFAQISQIGYGQDLGAEGMEIVFDASRLLNVSPEAFDPAALLATIHDEAYHQKRVDVRFWFFSGETGAEVLQLRRFAGIIDQIEIKEVPPSGDGPGGALMVIKCESVARRYGRREGRVRSHEDQADIWAGTDDFFKFVGSSIAGETTLYWGRKPSGAAAVGTVAPLDRTGVDGRGQLPNVD